MSDFAQTRLMVVELIGLLQVIVVVERERAWEV